MHHLSDLVGGAIAAESVRGVGQTIEMHTTRTDAEYDDEQDADQGCGQVREAQTPRDDGDEKTE